MSQPSFPSSPRLRELVIFFFRFRRRLTLAFALPFLLAVFISFLPTPRYKAESVLVVRMGAEYVYKPEVNSASANANTPIPFDREQIFKSEVAILESTDLHEDVIRTLGLDVIYPEIISPPVLSHIKDLLLGKPIFALFTPPLSQEALAQYQMATAAEVFAKRLDIRLEKESAVITLSFEHRDRALAEKALSVTLEKYFEKRKSLYLDPRATLAASQMQTLQERSHTAHKEVESFRLRKHISSLEEQRKLLLEKRSEAEKHTMTIRNVALERELAEYSQKLHQLDTQEREYQSLQKEAQLADDAYALSTARYNEAKAYEQVQRDALGSVRIIQSPSAPAEPQRLRGLILLAGGVLALFSACVTAALSEFCRRGFLTPEEAERQLKLPVLTCVPYIAAGKE